MASRSLAEAPILRISNSAIAIQNLSDISAKRKLANGTLCALTLSHTQRKSIESVYGRFSGCHLCRLIHDDSVRDPSK